MQGLVTTERSNLDPAAVPFAKNPRDLEGLAEGASIIEVVMLLNLFEENSIGLSLLFLDKIKYQFTTP